MGYPCCMNSESPQLISGFSSYTACDQGYCWHFYRTGEKQIFSRFWNDDAPLIVPKPIPAFVPKKRIFRMNGVVI